MHEQEAYPFLEKSQIAFTNLSDTLFSKFKQSLEPTQADVTSVDFGDLRGYLSSQSFHVLVIQLSSDKFQTQKDELKFLREKDPSLVIVVVTQGLGTEQIDSLINEIKVFSIIDVKDNLVEIVKKAIEDYGSKIDYYQNLNQLKKQNTQLESLNQNLEQLVHERTKKEFQANKQTELSLKGMQSILTFIKNISRTETIEDLMGQVRSEFKKFHGLMPPVLVLLNGTSQLRVFYFQGKQFTERKKLVGGEGELFQSSDKGQLRADLSNLFGRPYGAVSVSDLKFSSKELESVSAKFIFEHSLSESKMSTFSDYAKERWSLINMALENILLKEGLQNIAKQWAKTFNEMKDPIVIVDQALNITLSNSYFHEEIGADFKRYVEKKDKAGRDGIREAFETGEVHNVDISIHGKVYRVHSYPIRLIESEVVTHVINQYVDITQSIDLQSKVVQGEKMAAVGLLAGNIAHELNNPLTGIFSLSQLLLEDFDEETNTYKDLSEVKDAAARCQRIIKDLLDFSSVGSDSKTKVIEINELVSKTLPLLKMAMRTLNSNIQLCLEPIYVECNPQLLQQVIFNLVNNACQAMDDGGELTVVTSLSKNNAQIIVRDTGPGIPEGIRESIFDPFFTTKEEGRGTGLGLSMSRTVVEKHGGKLKLNEDYSDGTEFVITLPAVVK